VDTGLGSSSTPNFLPVTVNNPLTFCGFGAPRFPAPLMGRGQGGLTTVIFSGQNT
jgi:hypothetical protein